MLRTMLLAALAGTVSGCSSTSARGSLRAPVDDQGRGATADESSDLRHIDWVPVPSLGVQVARTEVTNAQYARCVVAGACTPPHYESLRCSFDDDPMVLRSISAAYRPVVCLTRLQARQFAVWAGGRLPTADELRRIATDDGQRKYPWGDAGRTCELAPDLSSCPGGNPRGLANGVCSAPAGSTPDGICDLVGNVGEWLDGTPQHPEGDADARGKVPVFGGPFMLPEGYVLVGRDVPSDRYVRGWPPDLPYSFIGLRPVRDVDETDRPALEAEGPR
ncbi:MAG: SUMF1/EgtB/PvdO family nonheme iron enzyme [Myxococcales bacterium]|nr:SUMF1/EgtB/PvdO family nonheme iron enzyme [Myxococcales bacterium]